jgi:hypothetical protein
MSINKNLNVAPYFDDYEAEKNFHRVLFKPSVAVQARELNQLQTILQDQIERFGTNILVEGSIVKGGNFMDIRRLPYVKIRDNNSNNQPIAIDNYVGANVTGKNSGVRAVVVTTLPGLETQSPDLNTLYIKYLESGDDGAGNDVKQFLPGETLEFDFDGVVDSSLTVAVAGLSIDADPIGDGYAVRCGDGIIFQKGHFIRFEDQIVIVERYSTQPHDKVVGFQTEELIVNSNNDTSLLDNASGFNNENAPGADRLQLTPRLVALTNAQGEGDETFFAVQEYMDGRLVRRNVTTQFNSVSKLMEQRTAEESGNYVVNNFDIRIGEDASDSSKLSAYISPGIAYVEGHRVETVGTLSVGVSQANTFNSVTQQDVLANYGNYIGINGVVGNFAFAQHGTVDLRDATQSATSTVGFTAAGTKIGTARVRSFTKTSGGYRLYLFDIRMNSGKSFHQTRSFVSGTSAFANAILVGGKAQLQDTDFQRLMFPIGRKAIKTVKSAESDYVARVQANTTANTSGGFTINATAGDTFPYGASATLNSDSLNDIVVSYSANGGIVPVTSASTSADAATLIVNTGQSMTDGTSIVVSYNTKKNAVKPIGKKLQTLYVRINASGDTTGPYHLGWPDVHSIEGIWKGSNTTFVETDSGISDVTNSFTLVKNQRDDFYDISFLKKGSMTISTADRFLVKAKVFTPETSGGYSQSFFSVDSYPVDDVSSTLPADKIRTENIPAHRTASGTEMNLRDAIDFRPYAKNNSTYATTAASATVWTSGNKLNTVAFNQQPNLNLVAPNENVEIGYDYYLGRKDRLIINEKGDFVNIEGIPAETPSIPNAPNRSMTLATVDIPPFPSLTSRRASRAGKREYGVSFSPETNKRFTMKDIGDIQKRVEKIEYYTVLNALEKSAEDMVIKGADGLNRFKNGILVDNFENLSIANVRHSEFSASVDKSGEFLAPAQRAYDLALGVNKMGTGVTNNDDTVITLSHNHRSMIAQNYATTFRNCVTDFYNFSGTARIFPEYDGAPDYTRAPDVNFDIDLATPFTEFTEALSEFVPLSTTDVRSRSNVRTSGNRTVTTTRTVTTNRELQVTAGATSTQRVGDFVTDVQFRPFLRANRVRIRVDGMRPNTKMHFFFDGKNVDNRVAPGSSDALRHMRARAKYGTEVRSDANGRVNAIFGLPAETFYVGDRELLITDVDRLDAISAATTSASVTYRGYNFSVEKTGLEVSTRMPNINVEVDRQVEVDRTVEIRRRGKDPIAQTFFVEKDYSSDNAVMLTKAKVYFEKKSPKYGVTLELRNTENGYPGAKILPFGKVHLNASQVKVSADGSLATEFEFPAPVTLATDTEYCIVILPDGSNPDYRIWVAKTGQKDVRTSAKITQDTNAGTLFTSTNNKAWTPYQDENMKFEVFNAEFTSGTGSVWFSNKDHEFFDISSYSGDFERGETAFVVNTNNTGTISVTKDNNVITGNGTNFTALFKVGDHIAYKVANEDYEVSEITAIGSATSMTLADAPKTTNTAATYFITTVGTVDYFNKRDPVRLHLSNSSAKTGRVFANGQTVRGENSEAVATIGSVINLPISYFQPNIYRTDYSKTKTSLYASKLSDGNTNYLGGDLSIAFNANAHNNRTETFVKSRSKEISENAGEKSFELRVQLDNVSNTTKDTSPFIDHDISSITAYEYRINDVSDTIINSEKGSDGLSKSKYISNTVELADGFDAEDIRIWLTSYRPRGSEINVFVRFKAATDPTAIENLPWTLLKIDAKNNFRSSVSDMEDYKEFEYSLDNTVLGNGQGAYLDINGNFVYKSSDGVIYNDYKYFDVKIVMNSEGQHRIPKVKDMRAIALT